MTQFDEWDWHTCLIFSVAGFAHYYLGYILLLRSRQPVSSSSSENDISAARTRRRKERKLRDITWLLSWVAVLFGVLLLSSPDTTTRKYFYGMSYLVLGICSVIVTNTSENAPTTSMRPGREEESRQYQEAEEAALDDPEQGGPRINSDPEAPYHSID